MRTPLKPPPNSARKDSSGRMSVNTKVTTMATVERNGRRITGNLGIITN